MKRLDLHLQEYYGIKKFTAKAKDWRLKFFLECESITQARKNRKSYQKDEELKIH